MCVVPTLLTFKFQAILSLCVIESLNGPDEPMCVESAKITTFKKRTADFAKNSVQRSDRSAVVWFSVLFLFWTCHLAFPPTLSFLINCFNSVFIS